MQVTTIGLDLAKNIFHVHGTTHEGEVAFNRPLRRAQLLAFFERLEPCLVGMEACGTSHHWARELTRLGHKVRLIPPIYVKPYVKRGKSDAADAEAICEAVTRPTMRFVEIKSEDQQALLSLHRMRSLIIRQRTQTINMLRALLAEMGIVFPQGAGHAVRFAKRFMETGDLAVPQILHQVVSDLSQQLLSMHERVNATNRRLAVEGRKDRRVSLLQTIPGVGPIIASAIVATIGNGDQFRSGRDLAAWLGLTPLNKSTGGQERLGRISKMGDRYIRRLLVVGMTSRIKQIRRAPERYDPWFSSILHRKPGRLAAVAMANKTARMIWAVLTKDEPYKLRTV